MRNWRDLQSLVYLMLLPVLVIWQWHQGFCWPLYLLELFLTLAVGVIHHNHAHLRIWRRPWLNRVTDVWICLLQGHPGFVFFPAHIANHHRHRHSERDLARTYGFRAGDTNHLLGYLLHPLQAIGVLYPVFVQYLRRRYHHQRAYFYYCILQYLLVLALWCWLAILDWRNWLVLALLPQLHGLHWLLATNYLQHAHTSGDKQSVDYARNFFGLLNPLLFNIGLHTAHHEHPRAHWSQLDNLHKQYQPQLAPQLQESSLLAYMLRVYLLGIFHARWRTHSLHKKD